MLILRWFFFSSVGEEEEGEEGEEGEEKMPSCGDYIMHFLTLPWKLIFALIPPTGKMISMTLWPSFNIYNHHHPQSRPRQ